MKKIVKNKKLIWLIVILVVTVVSSFFGLNDYENYFDSPSNSNSESADMQADKIEVHYIDVGQGDCSLVICDGKTMLIDAGENGNETKVLDYLRMHNIKKLDYIIASHQHTDHIGGLPEVIDEIGAENIIMPRLTEKQTPTNKTYTAFLKAIQNSDAKVIAAKVGEVYSLGDAQFEILAPIMNDTDNLNNMSVVVKLKFGERTFLFTGDAEKTAEIDVLASGADVDCDVLKVGHHGSGTSSCVEFLEAVTPKICVIQVGADNSYGHPHKNIIERLKNYSDKIYRNDICGDIVIESDGTVLNVKYENQ